MNKINLKKLMYPATIVLILIVTAIIFKLSVNFLSTNINKVFSLDAGKIQSQLISLDLKNFKTVAEKLGIAH